MLRSFFAKEDGQGLVEYALILVLIAIVVIGILTVLGGKVSAVFIQTRLSFTRDDGKRVTIQGPFGVFTDLTSSDVSVLGRDVTNNFAVIYSYPKRRVTLLAPPHDYQIQFSS